MNLEMMSWMWLYQSRTPGGGDSVLMGVAAVHRDRLTICESDQPD